MKNEIQKVDQENEELGGQDHTKQILKICPLDAKNGLKQNCVPMRFLCFGVFWCAPKF